MNRGMIRFPLLLLTMLLLVGCLDVKAEKVANVLGTVIDLDGNEVSGLVLSLGDHQTVVGSDGAFGLERIPLGGYLVTVTEDTKLLYYQEFLVDGGANLLEIELSEETNKTGEIISWTSASGDWESSIVDGDFQMKNTTVPTALTNAFAKVNQSGDRIIYEWTIKFDAEGAANADPMAGFYIMGSGTSGNQANRRDSYLIFQNATRVRLYKQIGGNAGTAINFNGFPVEYDQTHHYRVEFDTVNETMDIYRNGIHVGTETDIPALDNPDYVSIRASNIFATFSKVKVTIE